MRFTVIDSMGMQHSIEADRFALNGLELSFYRTGVFAAEKEEVLVAYFLKPVGMKTTPQLEDTQRVPGRY